MNLAESDIGYRLGLRLSWRPAVFTATTVRRSTTGQRPGPARFAGENASANSDRFETQKEMF